MSVFIAPFGPGSDCAISAAGIGRKTLRTKSSWSPDTVPVNWLRFTILSSSVAAPDLALNFFFAGSAVSVHFLVPRSSDPFVALVMRKIASPADAPARVAAKYPAAATVGGLGMTGTPATSDSTDPCGDAAALRFLHIRRLREPGRGLAP